MESEKEIEVGMGVTYHSFNNEEHGIITSWNKHFVFVRYGLGDTSAATRIEDLTDVMGRSLKFPRPCAPGGEG